MFALAALIAGWAGAGLAVFAALCAGAALAWAWTRRAGLAATPLPQRLVNTAIALAVLFGVLALLYWLGLNMGGHG